MPEEPLQISSLQNPRVKSIRKIRRRRKAGDPVLLEGRREIERAMAQGVLLECLYYSSDTIPDQDRLVTGVRSMGLPCFRCSDALLSRMTYREKPEGFLAEARPVLHRLEDLKLPSDPLLLVIEGVEKPGNLGAMLRSADAAGVDAVLVCDLAADIYNPNVIRASTGTIFSRPLVQISSIEAIHWLAENRLRVLAGFPDADVSAYAENLKGPLALVLGAEDQGLNDIWRTAADVCVRIPMLGQADSLNVSAATVVLLYEALRQRGRV